MKISMSVIILASSICGSVYANDWVTNNAILNLLRENFTNRVYIVANTRVETDFKWVSKPYAANCQRPLNLYLVSNQIGGFVNPKGWTFTNSAEPYAELMVQIKKDVQVYLLKNDIREIKVSTGRDLHQDYLQKDTQNNVPQRKQLTSTGLDNTCFWAPNGKSIAFLSARNTFNPNVALTLFELWIMDADGSNQRPLLSVDELYKTTSVRTISWSPNSNDMLVHFYVHSQPFKSEIWRITPRGNKVRLSSTNDYTERPCYSPDGNKIAFIIQEPSPPTGSPLYRLYVARIDFSNMRLIEKGLIGDYEWKNNSQGLIYSLYDRAEKNFDLWESSLDGTDKSRISKSPENEETLSCSDDGNYIAYSDYHSIYITATKEFKPRQIGNNARLPQWIPKRSLLFYLNLKTLSKNSCVTEPWIADINGNVIKKIEEGKGSTIAFSPAGDYFVYSVNGNIWLDYLP
jgi:WD40-like Beta Propeller Repeat